MAWPLILRGLAAAGTAIWRVAKNPAVRRAAVRAAKKAGNAFGRFAKKSKQFCSNAWRAIRGRNIKLSPSILQKKFKHAKDFGISGNYNASNATKLGEAIKRHVASTNTRIIKGTYRGQPVKHYVDPKTGLNVIKDASGQFVSGWKLSPAQLKHVLSTGNLGGG